jgi:PST family polysaccharide transporter
MAPAARRDALVRSVGLLALVTFPLAVGVGVVAPTLVDALLRPEWRDVGPMLAMLSVLSVVRPVGWTISAYLLARDQPRLDAALEVLKLVALVGFLLLAGRADPLWSCAAVGAAFALHAAASVVAVRWLDGIQVRAVLARCAPPLLACVPMVAVVLAVRGALVGAGVRAPGVLLAAELAAGAASYPPSALLLARSVARDLLALVRRALRERAAPSPAPVVDR